MVGEREGTGHGFKEGHLVNPLIEQARNDSLEFFGTEKPIPQPPNFLLELLTRLRSIGLTEVEGIYFPHASLGEGVTYPGWQTRIGADYYAWLKAGQINKALPDLSGRWAIVDTSQRPDYSDVKKWRIRWKHIQDRTILAPIYEPEPKDEIERIIQEARLTGKIAVIDETYRDSDVERVPYLPLTSRFGVSVIQQDDVVFPELAEKLSLTEVVKNGEAEIRRPTFAEFNYLGNLDRFSHLTQYGTSEAVQDVYKGVIDINKPSKPGIQGFPSRAIRSGNSQLGGVGQVDYLLARDNTDATSFRFVIAFA